VLAAAVLVAIVGTASAFSTVRNFFLDRGFIGLPPTGASPSIPESGELVVGWEGWSATLPERRQLVRGWVYADGRMIWSLQGSVPEGANELSSGYLEQRVTPDGVELVRSAVVALFDRSRALVETDDDPWPGYHPYADSAALFVPPNYGSGWGAVEVPDGDRLLRLHWRGQPIPEFEKDVEGTTATPEQVSALRRVDALLTNPRSVLPTSAWAVRDVRAYVPSHYAVCIDTSPPTEIARPLSLLPARAEELLRDKSWARSESDVVEGREGGPVVLGQRVTYCSKLPTAEAREVADALSGLEQDPTTMRTRLEYRLAEGVQPTRERTEFWFEPYFPHGRFTDSRPAG
jgi:hypothetical protein